MPQFPRWTGYINTGMTRSLVDTERAKKTIPLQRLGEAEEVAQLVRFLVDARYITGQVKSLRYIILNSWWPTEEEHNDPLFAFIKIHLFIHARTFIVAFTACSFIQSIIHSFILDKKHSDIIVRSFYMTPYMTLKKTYIILQLLSTGVVYRWRASYVWLTCVTK